MDSYCELKALPNPEIIQSAVVSALMQALHSLLPTYEGRIGLAFPAYGQQRTLGGIIRILGKKADIDAFHSVLANHLVIRDYALLTPVSGIPEGISKHSCYSRKQPKGNSRYQRQKKRHLERGTWSEALEQAMHAQISKPLRLPHVGLKSSSNGQSFLLFIERHNKAKAEDGQFNSYGLALDHATVPEF
ncbi:type I-F CRISPR-associated endoribonuclease Cas6/Csy4 [Thalassotalea sp. G20_0]|uniref:type I-F CRISPR-associated endoribonuclease Cas6/Csy4 n=1 Tax=Thalassotalea sp. G20_0 TaxID=2821093 RepID=UPI001ADB0DDF|nr:type I-F CRISPR-associated endoribonuclease Cas6/Csy4 [Thalassotalea sp. G20_0]MBO9494862.1 type I-F CRISPR-associated endoribonuclease Cas6/Csy4 [Thalassotalea sp. G20_0]